MRNCRRRMPGDDAYNQYDWFAPDKPFGFTQADLAQINQSIEAFVYCILGSQVNVRRSILGSGWRAKEAQSELLIMVKDAIRQQDLTESVQRYQLTVDEVKDRLNLAECPGVRGALVDAGAHGYQHRERCGLQQPAQASHGQNKARNKQQGD